MIGGDWTRFFIRLWFLNAVSRYIYTCRTITAYFVLQEFGLNRNRNVLKIEFIFCTNRYYLATSEHDSAVQHLYRVALLDPEHKSVCLSCNIIREMDGSRCLYNTAKFSTDNSHYVLTCAGPGVPNIGIYNKVRYLL